MHVFEHFHVSSDCWQFKTHIACLRNIWDKDCYPSLLFSRLSYTLHPFSLSNLSSSTTGLLSGYRSERESLDSQIQALEEQRVVLIVELDTTRSRLSEFERSQSEIASMRAEVGHQQELLRENAGQEMQGSPNSRALHLREPRVLSYRFMFVPFSVFLGAYLLRRWWMNSE